MSNNELPYMDPRKLLDPHFIICKFAEHEKRIRGVEARLHMLDNHEDSSDYRECIHKTVCALLEYGENCQDCEEYIPKNFKEVKRNENKS